MENAIQERRDLSPAEMIMTAVNGGQSLETLKGLLELQERWESNVARKEFAKAFSAAQAEIAPVTKSRRNEQTRSNYADLADVIKAIQPIYTKHGFSMIFHEGETAKPEHIRIICEVLHSLGHRETYYKDIPMDGKGIKGNANMTAIHGDGSATSYARRYLTLMIWNVATQDDDDGNGGRLSEPRINDEQLNTIRDLLIELGDEGKEAGFAKFLGAKSLEDIKSSDYKKAISVLAAKKERKSK